MHDGPVSSEQGGDPRPEPSGLGDRAAGPAPGRQGWPGLALFGIAAILVAAVAGTVLTRWTGPREQHLAVARPSASPAVPAVRPAPYKRPASFQFLDPEHGYLFYGLDFSDKTCPYLQVTNDGKTWSEPRRPRDLDCSRSFQAQRGHGMWAVATDVNTVAIHRYGQSFLSRDQGRTWRAYELRLGRVGAVWQFR